MDASTFGRTNVSAELTRDFHVLFVAATVHYQDTTLNGILTIPSPKDIQTSVL